MNDKNSSAPILHRVPVTAESIPPLVLTLTRDLAAGALLRMQADSIRALDAILPEKIEVDGREVHFEEVHRHNHDDVRNRIIWTCQVRSLVTWRLAEPLSSGSTLTFHLKPKPVPEPGGSECPALAKFKSFSGAQMIYRLGLTDDADSESFDVVSDSSGYLLHAGPPIRIAAVRKAEGRLVVTHTDENHNPSVASATRLTVSDGTRETEFDIPADEAARTLEVDAKLDPDARWTLRDDQGVEAAIHARPVALDGTPIRFGDFHWHCEFSGDGARPLDQALTSARDELGLDFAGPSDHISLHSNDYKDADHSVQRQAEICQTFDEPGRFITIPGLEMSGRYGHLNIYTRSWERLMDVCPTHGEDIGRIFRDMTYHSGVREISDLLPDDCLLIPHHTNTDSYVSDQIVADDGAPFWFALQWPLPAGGRTLRLAEMVQLRGVFESEAADPAWRNVGRGLGGSLWSALTRGYRLGFYGGTDNHNGWPTRGQDGHACGMTAIISEELTTDGLFDSLHDRRCYATTGARIVADATCNGQPIGTEQKVAPGGTREFKVRVRGTAPLDKVQLVHHSSILADWPVEADQCDFDITWRDERPGRPMHGAWYYVRIRQTDGHCAWLSPWWIDLDA